MAVVKTDSLEAHIYCYAMRVFGLIHPTAGAAVAEYLNRRDRKILSVTNALVYKSGSRTPRDASERIAVTGFYAVPKDRILWIKSGYYEASDPLSYETKPITLYFDDFSVSGDIRIVRGARLSDHLEQTTDKRPFQRLYNATVSPVTSTGGFEDHQPVLSESQVLTVHLKNAHGVSEQRDTSSVRVPTTELQGDYSQVE